MVQVCVLNQEGAVFANDRVVNQLGAILELVEVGKRSNLTSQSLGVRRSGARDHKSATGVRPSTISLAHRDIKLLPVRPREQGAAFLNYE